MKKNKEELHDEICPICKLVINMEKEFCQFTQFNNRHKIQSMVLYHVDCFRTRLNGGAELGKLQAQAKSIFSFAQDKLGMPSGVY